MKNGGAAWMSAPPFRSPNRHRVQGPVLTGPLEPPVVSMLPEAWKPPPPVLPVEPPVLPDALPEDEPPDCWPE
jgi:hypothetical protein